MSRTYSKLTTKNQKHPKSNFVHYLYHTNEPHDVAPSNISPELEAELLENSESMRQNFRHHAHLIRNR